MASAIHQECKGKLVVTRARFAELLRCLALAKLRFAANARPPASEVYARNPGIINKFR
jgi:hypothetical protein